MWPKLVNGLNEHGRMQKQRVENAAEVGVGDGLRQKVGVSSSLLELMFLSGNRQKKKNSFIL
jgi:hypothetical protein